ncbi:MAG: 50S ribosomal protein L5, partial [Synergistaceae bacterium]|nr:50S ribosomal protein L5 [Synergistaceae bacterium]
MIPRMLEKYKKEIAPALLKEFGYKNVMQIPKVQKVVVNIGVGDAKLDIKFMDVAIAELRAITGQQPLLKRAKKSIAGFKVRQGMPVA